MAGYEDLGDGEYLHLRGALDFSVERVEGLARALLPVHTPSLALSLPRSLALSLALSLSHSLSRSLALPPPPPPHPSLSVSLARFTAGRAPNLRVLFLVPLLLLRYDASP